MPELLLGIVFITCLGTAAYFHTPGSPLRVNKKLLWTVAILHCAASYMMLCGAVFSPLLGTKVAWTRTDGAAPPDQGVFLGVLNMLMFPLLGDEMRKQDVFFLYVPVNSLLVAVMTMIGEALYGRFLRDRAPRS